ncbi:MAG: diguanylate cyclase domain-containing protein, partial [Stellaceae bacterium]
MALDRALQEALIESRQRFKDLVEIATDFAWETDASGRFVFVSPKGALGWTANELVGCTAQGFVVHAAHAFAARASVVEEPLLFRRADRGTATLSVSAVPVEDAGGVWRGARGVCRDVTAELKRERELAAAQLRLQLFARILRVVRDEHDPTAAIDAAIAELGRAVGASGGVVLSGAAPGRMSPIANWGEMLDEAPLLVAAASLGGETTSCWHVIGRHGAGRLARCRDAVEGAVLLWQPEENGEFAPCDRALIDDVADYLGLFIAQRAGLERVVAASRTDPLTGLSNRRAFFEQLEHALARLTHSGDKDACGALLYVDVDNFKLVNDRAGHAAGDAALRQLSDILLRLSRVN